MSQETSSVSGATASAERPLPKNLPLELLPLYDWWKTNGSQLLVSVALVLLVGGGAYAYRSYRADKLARANKELTQASGIEELEGVVAQYGTLKAGNAARLRLAKAYFDADRFEDALDAYDACLGKGAPKGFEDLARMGRAYALEGLGRQDEALTAYRALAESKAGFLSLQASLGVARIYTLQGKKDEAKKLLETLKAQKTGEAAAEMAIAHLEGVIDRYEPRARPSLMDAANEAAQALQPPATAPVTAPAPAP